MDLNNISRTVFLNPDFKNTHINPNFLISKPSSIHINPAFLKQQFERSENVKCENDYFLPLAENTEKIIENIDKINLKTIQNTAVTQPKIISKSRTKIVREPAIIRPCKSMNSTNSFVKSSLIKIGKTKLIRKPTSTIISHKQCDSECCTKFSKKNNLLQISKGKYKLDRRKQASTSFQRCIVFGKMALKENLEATKVLVSKRKLLRIGFNKNYSLSKQNLIKSSNGERVEMLNINGVLYKSSRNKLQKTNLNIQCNSRKKVNKDDKNSSTDKRSIYIRGDKFVLDKSGFSLTRVADQTQNNNETLRRIDIGGLTYVAKSQNVYIRTNIHKTRNHLSSAKQKSINVLSKKLIKSNVPCPIFRKVGKCAAFERGRCPKVHDKMHVNICSKFLKGECNNDKCLLSHDVTLSKMPTCKFFLQGCCVRDDCLYLHKKLNEKTEICGDFLKGFCHLAEKCNKRHEFACPDFENTGKCEKSKCHICYNRKRIKNEMLIKQQQQQQQKKSNILKKVGVENKQQNISFSSSLPPTEVEKNDVRYFLGETVCDDDTATTFIDEETTNNLEMTDRMNISSDESISSNDNIEKLVESSSILGRRPKLGELPAFIPL